MKSTFLFLRTKKFFSMISRYISLILAKIQKPYNYFKPRLTKLIICWLYNEQNTAAYFHGYFMHTIFLDAFQRNIRRIAFNIDTLIMDSYKWYELMNMIQIRRNNQLLSSMLKFIYLAIDDDWCVDVSSAEGIADGIKIGL